MLDEICREGAQQMLAVALESEGAYYIESLVGELDSNGYRLVVRKGHARSTVTTVAGGVEIKTLGSTTSG